MHIESGNRDVTCILHSWLEISSGNLVSCMLGPIIAIAMTGVGGSKFGSSVWDCLIIITVM